MASHARVCVGDVGLLAVKVLIALEGAKDQAVEVLKDMCRRHNGS